MSTPDGSSGRVVAELGRPETPLETAERKAWDRALRRSRQNFRNLIASLVVCVAAVVLIVLLVPRGDGVQQPAIDVRSAAQQYGDTAGQPLLAPKVPASWRSNAAQLRGSGDTASWYVGWVIDGTDYAGLTEGLPGDSTVLATALDGAKATGTTTIGGLPWRVYDRRDQGQDAGNVAYGLATRIGTVVVAVYGTAAPTEVRSLAAAVATDAAERGLKGTGSLP
ncbi:DUF4245 domain-containing protein [Amnibacterium kyonggiense]|uniref:Uncharacterized protein DUF4245 n=1 Tax=Amnibacterium kyonggiense TaxID=595671 RepID=A0A4R7FJ57_9MICO|nr:DUF4245 domain-containing protein [Amnibacterium kyonggiense]TDS76022.1 uncharacterized protein DUF4245 [Amnibacterium kyonggiense]